MVFSTITGASIGLMAGGLVFSGFGMVYGVIKAASLGKTFTEILLFGTSVNQWLALGTLSDIVGSIIATAITNVSFEAIDWISKYNTRQPLIGPKNK